MKLRLVLSLVLAVSFNTLFAGGPWSLPKNDFYVKLSEWWIVFDEHYTDQGLRDPNLTTGIFNTNLYVEYGLTDRLTGIVNGTAFSRNYMNNLVSGTTNEILVPGESLNSIGDIDVSLKYRLNDPDQQFAIAVTGGVGIPSGTLGGGTQGNLQTGDGEFNQFVQFDFGSGINITDGLNSYVTGFAGFNNRTNGFSDEVRLGAELGLGFLDSRIWVIGRLNIIESLKNGDPTDGNATTSIFANNSELTSLGVEANFYITEHFGLSAGVAGALRAEIIAAAPNYSVGVFYDFN